jgi:hypothetical protein
MVESEKELLLRNLGEYLKFAESAFREKSYNVAVTLYFKALVSMCDLEILRREGRIPSNHTERFALARKKYQELYDVLDKCFPLYRDSYALRIEKDTAEFIRTEVYGLAERLGIGLKKER